MKDFNSNELFDITLALGVFDYIKNPLPFLEKMKNVTREMIIASYPAKFTFQAPIRKVLLYTKNCPVYFYTGKELVEMYKSIGINECKIIRIPEKMPTDYLVKVFA